MLVAAGGTFGCSTSERWRCRRSGRTPHGASSPPCGSRACSPAIAAAAVDVEGLVAAVVAMSALAYELGDQLDAVDVNPLIVHPGGAVAVDALVLPGAGGQSG